MGGARVAFALAMLLFGGVINVCEAASSSASSKTVVSVGTQADSAIANATSADVKRLVAELCSGELTAEQAAELTAEVIARAMAQAAVNISMSITTSKGGTACVSGSGWATSVATATADASVQALVEATCCPMGYTNATVATGLAQTLKQKSETATAKLANTICASNGESASYNGSDIQIAVAEVLLEDLVPAFEDIQACNGTVGQKSISPSPQVASPSPEPKSPSPQVTSPCPPPESCFYDTQPGDSLVEIAKRYKIPVKMLVKINEKLIKLPRTLNVCLFGNIPFNITSSPSPNAQSGA